MWITTPPLHPRMKYYSYMILVSSGVPLLFIKTETTTLKYTDSVLEALLSSIVQTCQKWTNSAVLSLVLLASFSALLVRLMTLFHYSRLLISICVFFSCIRCYFSYCFFFICFSLFNFYIFETWDASLLSSVILLISFFTFFFLVFIIQTVTSAYLKL